MVVGIGVGGLVACGNGKGISTSSSNGSNASLTWVDNTNGNIVIDASGNQYIFSSASGCMYLKNNSEGPENFCLSADASSSTGYANYGATNCSNPSSNTDCNTAGFDVVLTNNPSGKGCIAVLGNGGANAIAVNPLSITSGSVNQSGFLIQSVKIATAFILYDEASYSPGNLGLIPICGGSNPYAGTYLYEASGYCPSPDIASNETLTIDSGGIIFSAADDTWGVITSSGSGSFDDNFPNRGGFVHTFTGATKGANNLWMLSGTGCSGISFTLSEM